MSTKTWIIFIAVVVLLFGTLIFFSNRNQIDVSNVDNASIVTASESNGQIGDHVFGNADSPVVFIEYGDYQCPGCGSAYSRVKAVTEKYEGQVAFVFRNFPLTSIHPNARAAAAAAEAAGQQGKYWEMHDLLFSNQAAWENLGTSERTPYFVDFADQIGLDTTRFTEDLTNESISQKIAFDLALGKKAGVSSTPSFFLNGETVAQDIWSDDVKLEEAIRSAVQNAGLELPAEDSAAATN